MTTPTIPLTDDAAETEEIIPAATETPQDAAVATETDPDAPEDTGDAEAPLEDGDTFPRTYVEKLRAESAKYRQRAQQADALAGRLQTALVAATGRLADPSDLPFDESLLADPAALTTAVDDLLARKPHLASRKPRGDVGQGTSGAAGTVDLAGILRSRAS